METKLIFLFEVVAGGLDSATVRDAVIDATSGEQ